MAHKFDKATGTVYSDEFEDLGGSTSGGSGGGFRFYNPFGGYSNEAGTKIPFRDRLKGMFNNLKTNTSWSKAYGPSYTFGTGSKFAGKTLPIGKVWTVGNGIINGIQFAQSMDDRSDIKEGIGDLQSEIGIEVADNPYIWDDLNSSQKRLLREVLRDDVDTSFSINDLDLWTTLKDTALGALSGAPGGLVGAAVGGIGGLANSVSGQMNSNLEEVAPELEALYEAVMASERNRNQMAYAQQIQYPYAYM